MGTWISIIKWEILYCSTLKEKNLGVTISSKMYKLCVLGAGRVGSYDDVAVMAMGALVRVDCPLVDSPHTTVASGHCSTPS